MNRNLLIAALVGLVAGPLTAAAQAPGTYAAPNATTPAPVLPAMPPAPEMSGPPGLPSLTPEQSANLSQEMARYRQWVDERLARGELNPDEAQRLVEWRRWQLARQIAGQSEPAPRVVERQYAYGAPAYGPYYAPPPPPPVYYGPRISLCAGGGSHHAFGSVCF